MGPCQGGFCTYRAVAMLQELRRPPVTSSNSAIHDFLQERWKGMRPILWGDQMRQARLDQFIFSTVLNAQALPGAEPSRLAAADYE